MADVNYLSLPTNPDRAEVLARARGSGPVFDPRLGVWIVLDPSAVGRLLQDERLAMPDIGVALTALEARYNIHLPNLRWAASILPLLVNGERHRQVRAALAKYMSGEKKRAGPWRETVAALVADALRLPGKLDAFRGLLLPCVDAIFEDLTKVAVDFEPLTLTKIFDRYASYKQLVGLEGHIIALRARLASIGTPPEAEGTMASLVILGRDSLLSSLAESFLNLMQASTGHRLDNPLEGSARLFSGVAIAERIVTAPFTIDGAALAEGDRVRMYFGGYNMVDSETERLAFFGGGVHSCLGRSLAVEAWSLMASEISKSPLTVAAVQSEYDRGVVFTMPRYVTVDLV